MSNAELIMVGADRLHVPVPDHWERLDPLPFVPFIAHQPDGDWFRVNITVALDHGAYPTSSGEAGALLASQLRSGVLLDAQPDHDDPASYVVTVTHLTDSQDVVTVQRQLRPRDTIWTVSYTCAIEQFPDWRKQFQRWIGQINSSSREQ